MVELGFVISSRSPGVILWTKTNYKYYYISYHIRLSPLTENLGLARLIDERQVTDKSDAAVIGLVNNVSD